MARTIATAGTRIGIVTLAALGAFALPVSVGAAQASTTSVAVAAADCAALQATYDGLGVRVDVLEERLAVATPAQKPGLIAQIIRLQAQMTQVQQQMDAANCP
jgi:hypothetical protein